MTATQLLERTSLFLLDLDGTVYLGERPIGDMRRTLARLRGMGKRLVYLTNNSSKTEAQYREKLKRVGLWEEGDGVYTSGMAMAEYLNTHAAGKPIYLCATEAVRDEFRAAGIVLDDHSPEIAVLAYDVELTFGKIREFDRLLRRGLPFYATHPDDVCPTADGSMPDVGSFLAMFGRSSRRTPDVIVGKPYPFMAEGLERRYGIPRSAMCMAGDRMHTDIRFANNSGIMSVLVLSGETTAETVKSFPDTPDLVLSDLNQIFN